MTYKLAIHGAAGRMGKRLIDLGSQDARFVLVAAVEAFNTEVVGQDAGEFAGAGKLGVPFTATLATEADVIIDFSAPDAAAQITDVATKNKVPLVLATTALSPEHLAAVEQAATEIPIVYSPNMSMAVNLTMKLAQQAASTLKSHPGGVDVEILERHHRFKADSPSGTALKFGELISEVTGQTKATHGREGMVGERPRDEIAYHAIRTGDNPGEHTIVFGMLGETVELTVRASNRDCYAIGALEAAAFVAEKPPGIYSMADVLGFNE